MLCVSSRGQERAARTETSRLKIPTLPRWVHQQVLWFIRWPFVKVCWKCFCVCLLQATVHRPTRTTATSSPSHNNQVKKMCMKICNVLELQWFVNKVWCWSALGRLSWPVRGGTGKKEREAEHNGCHSDNGPSPSVQLKDYEVRKRSKLTFC